MKTSLAVCTVCVASLASSTHAQTLFAGLTGGSGHRLGAAMIDAGDQNGDGFPDLLIGAPGFNGGRGMVQCVSGAWLSMGSLPASLWSITAPPVNADAGFGTAMVRVGDLTGNSAGDFVISAPSYIPSGAFDSRGAIFLVDGSTHAIVTYIQGLPQTHFGQVMVAVGDQTGDFKTDIAVSAPDVSSSVASIVHVVPGSAFGFSTQLATIPHASHQVGWHAYGAALASGFDYDGDGKLDLAISIPDYGISFPGAGYVEVCKANTFAAIQAYTTNVAGEHFGAAIDAGADYNGDGVIDLVVGAPNWNGGFGNEDGRVLVLSGAKFVNPSLPGPIEIYTLTQGASFTFDVHFGAVVRACGDLNHDGVRDILAGAPDYRSFPPIQNKGYVSIVSGATGQRWALIEGVGNDHFGDSVATFAGDFGGDGFDDIVVAGALSDNGGGTDAGVVRCFRLFAIQPSSYCTGKANSAGCVPSVSSSGLPSSTSSSTFLIGCSNQINQKSGLLMYSHAPNAAAFQGGTLCVKPPLKRTPQQNSGGSATGSDCTGSFSFDFNAAIQGGADPTLVTGAEIYAQYWGRDAASPSTTSLSNALRFVINP